MLLAFGLVKLSITYFYRRLFVTRRGSAFDWATIATIVIVGLWTVSFFFGFLFGCGTHVSFNWGSVEDESHCTALLDLDNALVVSDLITDIIVLCLPLGVVGSSVMSCFLLESMTENGRSGTFR